MRRTVELYGRLRDAAPEPSIEVEAGESATAGELMEALKKALGARAGLLEGVVLATEAEVLKSSDRVPREGRLAALPPVCGG